MFARRDFTTIERSTKLCLAEANGRAKIRDIMYQIADQLDYIVKRERCALTTPIPCRSVVKPPGIARSKTPIIRAGKQSQAHVALAVLCIYWQAMRADDLTE